MNSVGVLPLPYLNNTDRYKALAAFGNAQQILAQFLVKQESKKRTELFFQHFEPLRHHELLLEEIHDAIDAGLIEKAEQKSVELIHLSLQGLNYYQKYDWFFLRSVISLGYLGWMAYCIIFIIKKYVVLPKSRKKVSEPTSLDTYALLGFLGLCILLWVKKSPFQYYLYVAFPIYFLMEVSKEKSVFYTLFKSHSLSDKVSVIWKLVVYILGLELLVYSYFQREVLSGCLIASGILGPIFLEPQFRSENKGLVTYWIISNCVTSIFTLLPVEKGENMALV